MCPSWLKQTTPVGSKRFNEFSSPRTLTISSLVPNFSLPWTVSPYTLWKKAGMTVPIRSLHWCTLDAAINSFHSSTISTIPWGYVKHSGTEWTMLQQSRVAPKSCRSAPPHDCHQTKQSPGTSPTWSPLAKCWSATPSLSPLTSLCHIFFFAI